jgi:signal transduction histidine kinase
MRRYLILKLLAITLVGIVFVVAVVWWAIDSLAAGYFVTLMEKYHISPEPAHAMFVEAVHRYLLWAFVGAVVLAVTLSYVMLRKVLAPLVRMTGISRDIAAGDFSARVPVGSRDEVGQLASAFNRMAADLDQLENLRRKLMIDVAHELRTPLTNIRGYLEAIDDGVLPPSPETITLLHGETMRLASLVEDVLQLAKADAARGRFRLEPIDLRQTIEAAVETFRPGFVRKGISVTVTAPPEQCTLSADRNAMARILRNLTDNAVQYTPRGASVAIELVCADGQAVIVYSNPAEELLSDDLPFLFERFYRGEKSRSREHGGAGIGLSLVQELVKAHGGTVGAELTDGHLRIRVTLPMLPADPGR